MRVIFHGQLRERYGSEISLEARTVGEAISGVSMQLPDWPRELVIEVPGFASPELLDAQTDIPEIHMVPAMFGGSGKFLNIIVGAALIGISFIPGIGTALSPVLLSAGVGMLIGGVMALFMKAPTISKSNDPPASKYFGVNDNTTESGTPWTLAYGRINLFGHWLSLQADSDNLVIGTFPGTPT